MLEWLAWLGWAWLVWLGLACLAWLGWAGFVLLGWACLGLCKNYFCQDRFIPGKNELYWPHAVADGSQRIQIKQKTLDVCCLACVGVSLWDRGGVVLCVSAYMISLLWRCGGA